MSRAEIDNWIGFLRTHGRVSRLVRLQPPTLPSSRRLRHALEREAEHDPHVRRAIDRAIAAEHAKPTLLRRLFTIDEMRIF